MTMNGGILRALSVALFRVEQTLSSNSEFGIRPPAIASSEGD